MDNKLSDKLKNILTTNPELYENREDLDETVNQLNNIIAELQEKEDRFHIMQLIALLSEDENIKEIRNQLLTTVKIVHQELIEEVYNCGFKEYEKSYSVVGSNTGTTISAGIINLSPTTPVGTNTTNITNKKSKPENYNIYKIASAAKDIKNRLKFFSKFLSKKHNEENNNG